jgi:hypothetical protein
MGGSRIGIDFGSCSQKAVGPARPSTRSSLNSPREQAIDVQLMLVIYEMNERNTPGVGHVLSKYGMESIPEAHCYLRLNGSRIDVTGVPVGAEPIGRFLHEEPITVEQIGEYKNRVHRQFLNEWAAGKQELDGLTNDDLWRIREERLAALGAGVYRSGA